MESNWKDVTWGDILTLNYGKSLKGYRESSGPIPVYGSNGAVGWTEKSLATGPGVILGRKGAYRGIEYCKSDFNVIDTAYFVSPIIELDIQWLYYAMKGYKVGEIDDGSPIPSTTRSAVYISELQLPPLAEQKRIAHILGSLDDKIELNRKMNATLEAMAQALFKSWFVDFDPVIDNALRAGNPIPAPLQQRAETRRKALADPTTPNSQSPTPHSSLFPATFTHSEDLGWIPEGWEVEALSDQGKIVTGKTPKGSVTNAYGKGVPFLTPSDYDGSLTLLGTARELTQNGQDDVAKTFLPAASICVTCIGSQMGKTMLSSSPVYTNQQINSVVPHSVEASLYLLFNLRARRKELFNLGSSGSTMPILNKSGFSKLRVLKPNAQALNLFHSSATAIIKKMQASSQNIKSLTKLRDTLLPQLISGELRLPDAEHLTTDAIA